MEDQDVNMNENGYTFRRVHITIRDIDEIEREEPELFTELTHGSEEVADPYASASLQNFLASESSESEYFDSDDSMNSFGGREVSTTLQGAGAGAAEAAAAARGPLSSGSVSPINPIDAQLDAGMLLRTPTSTSTSSSDSDDDWGMGPRRRRRTSSNHPRIVIDRPRAPPLLPHPPLASVGALARGGFRSPVHRHNAHNFDMAYGQPAEVAPFQAGYMHMNFPAPVRPRARNPIMGQVPVFPFPGPGGHPLPMPPRGGWEPSRGSAIAFARPAARRGHPFP